MNPFWRFGLASLGTALGFAVIASLLLPPLPAWFLAINTVTLCVFRYDKMIAGSQRIRVPESVLLLITGLGGTLGAAAAIWLIRPRHKSRSADFLIRFMLILAVQFGLVLFYLHGSGNF